MKANPNAIARFLFDQPVVSRFASAQRDSVYDREKILAEAPGLIRAGLAHGLVKPPQKRKTLKRGWLAGRPRKLISVTVNPK